MNLFILSIYDSAYAATMYENGSMVDVSENDNWVAFFRRFKVPPEQVTIEDLQKVLPPNTKIILCVDGYIEIADGLAR